MIKGFYPNRTIANSQLRLNRQKTTVATIGTVATISNNTGATFSGLTLATLREANATTNYNPNGPNANGHQVQSFGSGDRAHLLVNASVNPLKVAPVFCEMVATSVLLASVVAVACTRLSALAGD